LLALKIYFKIKAINVQSVRHQELPDCYDFNIKVSVVSFHTYLSDKITFQYILNIQKKSLEFKKDIFVKVFTSHNHPISRIG